ncbi:(2Fe-2S)-binding protein [Pelagicoccus enzymogenes]|uniref:(2Fe-2S)-binding protein n=1 Tax=Pelagicoccus enzymogenes TaxID=2773457 RepID=UPI00280EEB0C|nr:2Fe-2S iron-sulfur cluster-binding protein [Pelagicoccus enzymogenes]MDQ8198107.1 (2Fe-2S)-binding protein [Pelagicoccus enzymogenes]
MEKIALYINGSRRELEADPEMPLLWVLRDLLGMTGTKYGCGVGRCGCCTVHLNGVAVRSCQTPVVAAGGMPVTTIEGLSEQGDHPVQQAWREENTAQCGYCQAGQMMTAAALLMQIEIPDDAAIDGAMSGNLCRCGTYKRIRKAIKRAAAETGKEHAL